jgi:hypothetical protein
MDFEVALFDHRYGPVAAADVNVTLPPLQNDVGPDAVTTLVGVAFTVTVVPEEVAEQPPACVTVTLYVPPDVTLIEEVVAPVDQRYEAPAFAFNVTAPPEQNVVAPEAVTAAVPPLETVTAIGVDTAEHPFVPVTVTE